MIGDLRGYLAYLESKGRLARVKGRVARELEVTAFTDRANREGAYEGKALLFEDVDGSGMPVATNLFGSMSTMRELFDRAYVKEMLAKAKDMKSRGPDLSLVKGSKMLLDAKPKEVKRDGKAYRELGSLDELPILKSWPKDAGMFITLPLVVTESPADGSVNVGVYRMQVFGKRTTGMHWQAMKGGALHAKEALERNGRLNVSVAIGTDPFNTIAAVTPLPVGFNEFAFSGMLRGAQTQVVKEEGYPPVPANSEIVLYGYVDPKETRIEGPFGDHTGYYSIAEPYPVFHIERMLAKKDAVYTASVVGHPWHEDAVMGLYMMDFMLPAIKAMNESIVDMYLPPEGVFTNMCFVSMRKRFPGEAKKVMFSILGTGQLSFTKIIAVFDDDVDIRDLRSVMWALSTRIDPQRDVQIIANANGDSLDHASNVTAMGSKMLIDATRKTKEEGYNREWPETISLPEGLVKEVERKWESLKK